MIVIVDYGMGNLGSVLNMFKKLGVKAYISRDQEEIKKAEKLLLPGVGAFDTAMNQIHKLGLFELLNTLVLKKKTPILGVCLGMQLMMETSEEGKMSGFGWIKGKSYNFKGRISPTLKVPHMGWNTITILRENNLFKDMDLESRFYFVHSYHIACNNPESILATTHYGRDFVSIIKEENIMGVQFHPEKSHKFGMKLLKNFAELT